MEKKLKTIIKQVGDIGEKLSSLPAEKSPPTIETDIILRDIRVLYEAVKDLQASSAGAPSGEVEKKPESKVKEIREETITVEEAAETVSPPMETDSSSEVPEKTKPADQKPEPVEKKTEKADKKTETAGKKPEPATLADKFKGEKKFINESLAGQKQDIGSKIHSTPISSIGSALGVNDRFTLINDLFKGDKDSFQNTIGILDGASNFNEAFSYISGSFDWDMEEDSVQLLLDLVRRKFIVNQDE